MTEKKPVVINREFKAPIEKVWAAWTEEEQMKKWWGPQHFTAPSITIDLKVGGKYLFCMRGAMGPGQPEIDMWSAGTYEEIVPLKKLVYTDHFADEKGNYISPATYGMADFDEEMRVTVEFESLPDGGTKMTVTHEGAVPGTNADNMSIGWNQSFDKLNSSVSQ